MTLTYTNPVWPRSFADPFVLRWQGEYYAYGTGPALPDTQTGESRVFPLLRSRDLVHWEECSGALLPLTETEKRHYWAPEVVESEGRFYLYYSASDGSGDETQRLRVAVADHPLGPFVDSGTLLLPDEGFSIDAHPFRDPADGRWYLFFAKDYFDARVGTALAVVPLAADMISVSGPVQNAVRPVGDWQIYERNRMLYNQTWEAWHTVEGPFVLFDKGRYYCLYSGGNWQGAEYGVGYAVADQVLGPYQDSGLGPAVLKGVSGIVLGPGHNSVVLGPDNKTCFIVYHAWDAAKTARRLCIDPLVWTGTGPLAAGPTYTPQTISLPDLKK